MKSKSQRLAAIKKIVAEEEIQSQEVLLQSLEKQGFSLTQATLSRDLKLLQVAKIPTFAGYIYQLQEDERPESSIKNEGFPVSGFVSIEFSGQLAVIKTKPGFANGIASVIDSHSPMEILGTIAGDDTILLIPREGFSRQDVINALKAFIPELKK